MASWKCLHDGNALSTWHLVVNIRVFRPCTALLDSVMLAGLNPRLGWRILSILTVEQHDIPSAFDDTAGSLLPFALVAGHEQI